MKKLLIFFGIIVACAVIGAIVFEKNTPTKTEFKHYTSLVNNISFDYPPQYLVIEKLADDTASSISVIELLHDTQANRDILNGTSLQLEGPMAITIEFSPNNPITADAGIMMGNSASTTIDSLPAVAYSWGGLYEGDSVVVNRDTIFIKLSVTYDASDSVMRKDFKQLLASVKLRDITADTSIKNQKVTVDSPSAGTTLANPLVVHGTAVGNWYFEASFPVKLFDGNGRRIAETHATAEGEWMTAGFVPFSATLTFKKPATTHGTLVLEKDNPSGNVLTEEYVAIPISF